MIGSIQPTGKLPRKLVRLLENHEILSDNEQLNQLTVDVISRIYRDIELTRFFVSRIRRRDRVNLVQTAELSKPERYAYQRFRNSLTENKRLRVENITDEILTYIIGRTDGHPDFDRNDRTPFRLKLTEMIYKMRKKAYNEKSKYTLNKQDQVI